MKAEWTNKDSLSIESTGQKAILVTDMPDSCLSCDYTLCHICDVDKFTIGDYMNGKVELIKDTGRHISCPFKSMPEKKEVEVNRIEDIMHTEFSIEDISTKIRLDTDKIFSLGWNACIDEILGETE